MRSSFARLPAALRRTAALTGLATLFALAGCGGPKGLYAGASARAERAAAEAASAPPADATLQTQGTYVRLVEQMQRDGLYFASIAHLDALELRWGSSPATVRLRADALRQTGQAAESRRQYTLLLATPLAGAGYHGLGLLAGAEADYAGAIALLVQAQQRNPTDAVVLSDLGYANLRAGRLDAARVPLMQAAQLLPDNPKVQANLAVYLIATQQGEQSEALMAAQKLAPATRAAIRQAALELGNAPTPAGTVSTATPPATTTATADAVPPLALRPSGWPRRVHVLVREAVPATPDATASTALTALSTEGSTP